MTYALRILATGIAAMIAASPAMAADWWLVSGAPSDPTAVFADIGTLQRNQQSAEMRVLRVDRAGRSFETVQQIQCDKVSTAKEEEDVRQFACASEKERDQHGLILAAMSPVLVAQMIFQTDATAEASRKSEPRT